MAVVRTKQLINIVANTTKYHKYEVEDIMAHLIEHMQIILAGGDSVKLSGIGTLSVKTFKPRLITFEGQAPKMSYNAVGMSIKLDETMRVILKGAIDARAEAKSKIATEQ
jgi:nucleoid DNA-binding protein